MARLLVRGRLTSLFWAGAMVAMAACSSAASPGSMPEDDTGGTTGGPSFGGGTSFAGNSSTGGVTGSSGTGGLAVVIGTGNTGNIPSGTGGTVNLSICPMPHLPHDGGRGVWNGADDLHLRQYSGGGQRVQGRGRQPTRLLVHLQRWHAGRGAEPHGQHVHAVEPGPGRQLRGAHLGVRLHGEFRW